MSERTFRAFLRTRGLRGDAGGEFIDFAEKDRQFPEIETWGEWRRYLNDVGAPHETMVAARAIWRRYKLAAKAVRLSLRTDDPAEVKVRR